MEGISLLSGLISPGNNALHQTPRNLLFFLSERNDYCKYQCNYKAGSPINNQPGTFNEIAVAKRNQNIDDKCSSKSN